jgi:E3 ubiquitin-protein ligase UBR3
LTNEQSDEIVEKYSQTNVVSEKGVPNIGVAMAFVLNNLDKCKHIRSDSVLMSDSSLTKTEPKAPLNLDIYEKELQKLCLPFLRMASLLRHHIYHSEIPEIKGAHLEFARLVYYLELVTKSMDWDKFNASKALCFLPGTEMELPKFWLNQLKSIRPSYESTRSLIVKQHIDWQQPRLLGLPREYEKLFTVRLIDSKEILKNTYFIFFIYL